MDEIKPVLDADIFSYDEKELDDFFKDTLPSNPPHKLIEPLNSLYNEMCTKSEFILNESLINNSFLNNSFFNSMNYPGICSPGEIWLVCRNGISKSCYAETDLIDFTNAIPPKYAYTIYGIVFPCLVSLAFIANLFILLVLSQRHMQSPTNIILKYMSLADLFVGLVPLPFTFYWFTLRTYLKPNLLSPFWCYVYHYLMDTIPPVCHNVAIWLTVLLAVQRYVYIEYPLRAHHCTIEQVKRASIIILIISLVCGSMKFGDSSYETYTGYVGMNENGNTGTLHYVPGLCVTTWSSMVRWFGTQRYYAVYFWIRATVFVWVPCLLLICLNIMLIRALHETQRRRRRLFSDGGIRQKERQKESYATSTMLVVVVSVFLVVNLPQGLFVALITADQALELKLDFLSNDGIAPLILMIDNMLILATYPFNFAVYCSMSTLFRDTFKRLFCTNLPPLTASRRASSFGYLSYATVGTVVPAVHEATATATVIFEGSPNSTTALLRHYNHVRSVARNSLTSRNMSITNM